MRHINHINHLSGLHHHHQKKKKKKTTRIRDNEKKRQRENATTREEDSFFNPTSDGSSQRRTHGTLFLVCLVVREECGTKNSRFSPQKSKKHTKIENPKHFFLYGFKNHLFFSPKDARRYSFLSQKNTVL